MTQEPRLDLETLPILPLRNSVVFPASVVPINVGRARSVRLVEDLLLLSRLDAVRISFERRLSRHHRELTR